ncbi:WD40 repeat-like protein [Tothia fuscella]|uniref:WD40 repeat-like protein n=1 Tax=Tothia fuscella TaxID=1048955 RepID=A0A9P4NJ97_9PEZI|nr:WD40 repeat-like protein [Tothia fuscella]
MNYITFNQDYSSVAVASTKGFRTYSTEPFSETYRWNETPVAMVEVLFSTSLHALVLSPRLLRILNTKKGATICELTFPTKILAIQINRKRLVVVLDGSIYLYDISNMKLLHTIETPPNPHALCSLSPSSDNNLLVYPCPVLAAQSKRPAHVPPGQELASNTSGDVRVFDATKLEAIITIQAHQTAIGCLALNNDATMLATASEKGTVIRIFSVPEGSTLFKFRRGTTVAMIYSMSFNATSTLLCVSSATETVHIFRLLNPTKGSPTATPTSPAPPSSSHERRWSSSSRERSVSPSDDELRDGSATEDSPPPLDRRSSGGFTSGFASMIRQKSRTVGMGVVSSVSSYLPASVTQTFEPQRDFAHVKIPRLANSNSGGSVRSIVAMSPNHPQLFVITSEGVFGVYSIDLQKGGEGVLEHQYSLQDNRNSLGTDAGS